MQKKDLKKVHIFAVDTNVVLSLFYLKNKHFASNQYQKRNKNLEYLDKQAQNKKIFFVVPTNVLKELRILDSVHNLKLIDFAKSNYFYKINFNVIDEQKFKLAINYIAEYYCRTTRVEDYKKTFNKDTIDINPNLLKPAFIRNYNGEPLNDCKIMAECSFLDLMLITSDFKDFIKGHRDKKIKIKNAVLNLGNNAVPISCQRAVDMLKCDNVLKK